MRKSEELLIKKLARRRIDQLFAFADRKRFADIFIANSAVALARRIAMKADIRIPRQYKIRYCGKCGHLYSSNDKVRVRTRTGRGRRIVIRCGFCGNLRRVSLQ